MVECLATLYEVKFSLRTDNSKRLTTILRKLIARRMALLMVNENEHKLLSNL